MNRNYLRFRKLESASTLLGTRIFHTFLFMLFTTLLVVNTNKSYAQLGGGDTCGNATVIPSIPFLDTANTIGATDNYNEVCPYTPTGAVDVVYQYTPTTNVLVELTLCLQTTNYDTKMYIYSDSCNGGPLVGCNDDDCDNSPVFTDPYLSRLSGINMMAGTTYYIVVDGYSLGDEGPYTLSITEICADPGAPAVSNITASSADVNWGPSPSAPPNYEVEYGPSGFTPGNGMGVLSTDTAEPLTGLSTATAYDVYVRAICAVGDSSGWVGPASFVTQGVICGAVENPATYSESFETGIGSWTQSLTDDFDWTRDANGTTSSPTGPSTGSDGAWYMYIETSTPNYPFRYATLNSACFDMVGAVSPIMAVDYHMFGATIGTLQFDVTRKSNGQTDSVWALSGNQGDQWYTLLLDLTPYVGDTIVISHTGNSTTDWLSDIAVDNWRAVPPNDAACVSIDAPITTCAATENLVVTVQNNGSNALTAVTINYSVNGVLQTPFAATGLNIPSFGTDQVSLTSSYTTSPSDTIIAWTTLPNGVADPNPVGDTAAPIVVGPGIGGGTYTIGATGTFPTIQAAFDSLGFGGICGPVTLNLQAGTYNEQVTIPEILGADTNNQVILNGGGNTLTFASTSSGARHTVWFDGADWVTIDNLAIEATGTSYGWGIRFSNAAMHNTISNCDITVPQSTSSTAFNGIVATNSATSATSDGYNHDYTTIDNCTVEGGYYGIFFNNDNNPAAWAEVTNNEVYDQYAYPIRVEGIANGGAIISGNEVYRMARTVTTTFYGVACYDCFGGVWIEENEVHDPYGSDATPTSTSYGVYCTNCDGTAANPNYIVNNLVHNFSSTNGTTTGTQYGIYTTGSNFTHTYHNTVVLDDQNSTSGSTRGIYNTGPDCEIWNNVVYVSRTGTTAKYGIYNTGANQNINYNGVYVSSGTNTSYGYQGSAQPTLNDWRNAGNGANSVQGNPYFVDAANDDYHPRTGIFKASGVDLTSLVPTDYNGTTRTVPPDMGGFQFTIGFANDMQMIGTSTISSGCDLGAQTVDVVVRNIGSAAASNFNVDYDLNGTPTTGVTVAGPLASLDYDTVQIPLNIAMYQQYSFRAYTSLAGDTLNDWDTSGVFSFENFETPVHTVIQGDTALCDSGTVTLIGSTTLGSVVWTDTSGAIVHVGDTFVVSVSSSEEYDIFGQAIGTGSLDAVPFTGGNGCGGGSMFDVIGVQGVAIDSFSLALGASAGTSVDVGIWFIPGSYVGNETNQAAWTYLDTVTVTSAGALVPTYIPLSIPFPVGPGQSFGIYLNADVDYTNGAFTFTNADVEIQTGTGLCGFFSGTNNPRSWNGSLYYTAAGCASLATTVDVEVNVAPGVSFTVGTPSGLSVPFTQTISPTPDNFSWDFGDGNFGSTANPTHTYASGGTYNVCLTADIGGCDSVFCDVIVVNGLNQSLSQYVNLYPNPTSGQMNLEVEGKVINGYQIVDMLGREVLSSKETIIGSSVLDLQSLSSGSYLIKMNIDDQILVERIAID